MAHHLRERSLCPGYQWPDHEDVPLQLSDDYRAWSMDAPGGSSRFCQDRIQCTQAMMSKMEFDADAPAAAEQARSQENPSGAALFPAQ